MKTEIKVIFRWDKKNKEAIAFFPEASVNYGCILCYMHVGQHSESSLNYFNDNTRKAKINEYKELLEELESIYNDNENKLVLKERIYIPDLQIAWKRVARN